MTRLFDLLASFFGIVLLSPLFILTSLVILIDSGLPVLYLQERVGYMERKFRLIKFRSMTKGSEAGGLLTVGSRDARVTRVGYFLRRYKLDELPQLFNVLKGDMALVGPRPEVEKYVRLYSKDQKKVLEVRPGITDPASLEYINENEILANYPDPERAYTEQIMPRKLELNLRYLAGRNFLSDLRVILKTISGLGRDSGAKSA